jgi:hypothetical protein
MDEWFRGYVQTYVERDVRQLSQVTDLIAFQTFTTLEAMRTATVPSRQRPCSRCSSLGHHSRLPPFLQNRSSRLIKSPKLYMTDSGMAAHLAGVRTLEVGAREVLRQPFLETYVAQNLSAILEAHCPDARLTYWHEQGRHEVDFVIEYGQNVTAIEVKAAARWSAGDLAGLQAFLRRTPECTSAILAYNGTEAFDLGDRLYAIPLGHLVA